MALPKTQVSQLYVSIFGRASEGSGNTFWQTDPGSISMTATADKMLATQAAKSYFGTTLDTNQAFIEHIYQNTLGKAYEDDPSGVDFWVDQLDQGKTRGLVIATLIEAAQHKNNAGAAQDQFNNKVIVSNYSTDNIVDFTNYATFSGFISTVTDIDATVHASVASIDETRFTISPPQRPHGQTSLPSNLSLDWVDATEITLGPHKAIGQITVTLGNKSSLGTGFLISPEHVLTSAHVLLDESGSVDSTAKITFSPGLNGDTNTATSYDWQKSWVEKNFDSSLYPNWPDNDLGIIKLDQPLKNNLGHLKLEAGVNLNLEGVSVKTAGYSADTIQQNNPTTPGPDYYQWEASGIVDRYIYDSTGLKFSEGMQVTAGASGSPIYYTQNNETYFTGVLAGNVGNRSVAAAMDQDSYNWVLGILQQDGYYTDYTPV